MKNFQGIIFIWTWTYREIFKSTLKIIKNSKIWHQFLKFVSSPIVIKFYSEVTVTYWVCFNITFFSLIWGSIFVMTLLIRRYLQEINLTLPKCLKKEVCHKCKKCKNCVMLMISAYPLQLNNYQDVWTF